MARNPLDALAQRATTTRGSASAFLASALAQAGLQTHRDSNPQSTPPAVTRPPLPESLAKNWKAAATAQAAASTGETNRERGRQKQPAPARNGTPASRDLPLPLPTTVAAPGTLPDGSHIDPPVPGKAVWVPVKVRGPDTADGQPTWVWDMGPDAPIAGCPDWVRHDTGRIRATLSKRKWLQERNGPRAIDKVASAPPVASDVPAALESMRKTIAAGRPACRGMRAVLREMVRAGLPDSVVPDSLRAMAVELAAIPEADWSARCRWRDNGAQGSRWAARTVGKRCWPRQWGKAVKEALALGLLKPAGRWPKKAKQGG